MLGALRLLIGGGGCSLGLPGCISICGRVDGRTVNSERLDSGRRAFTLFLLVYRQRSIVVVPRESASHTLPALGWNLTSVFLLLARSQIGVIETELVHIGRPIMTLLQL